MADLTTTVHSPAGPVLRLDGRVSKQIAFDRARKMLRRDIEVAQRHLDEFDNWETTCERGSARAKTYEEM